MAFFILDSIPYLLLVFIIIIIKWIIYSNFIVNK